MDHGTLPPAGAPPDLHPSSLFLPLRAYLKEASRSFQPKPESSGSVLGQDSGGHDTDITAPASAESRAETAAARASPLLWELGNSVSKTQLLSSPGSLLLTPAPRRSASRPAGRRPTESLSSCLAPATRAATGHQYHRSVSFAAVSPAPQAHPPRAVADGPHSANPPRVLVPYPAAPAARGRRQSDPQLCRGRGFARADPFLTLPTGGQKWAPAHERPRSGDLGLAVPPRRPTPLGLGPVRSREHTLSPEPGTPARQSPS